VQQSEFQVKKLLQELKDGSASETFEDDAQRILTLSKAAENEKFKEDIKVLNSGLKMKEIEYKLNQGMLQN